MQHGKARLTGARQEIPELTSSLNIIKSKKMSNRKNTAIADMLITCDDLRLYDFTGL
jgi:hypothetical protein